MNYPLLRLLADGQLHSGTEMARVLGVSRTAVWKHLQQLESQGLELSSVRGRGYQLVEPLDLLDPEAVLAGLESPVRSRVHLSAETVVTSTNDALLSRPSLFSGFDVCIAEQQTAGRGRRGRDWISPFASNLYLSVGFEVAGHGQALQGLSLVAGVAVAEALEQCGVRGVSLKWPNDVWLNGRKVAGILAELQGAVEDRFRLVIGVGLNVYMRPNEQVRIDQPWTSLAVDDEVPAGGRNQLAVRLIESLVRRLSEFSSNGIHGVHEAWELRDALMGQPIEALGGDARGIGQGIDAEGRLRVRQADGSEVAVNAGEVSIRVSDHDRAD